MIFKNNGHQEPTKPRLSPMGEEALHYASQGWKVFPLKPGCKGGPGEFPVSTEEKRLMEREDGAPEGSIRWGETCDLERVRGYWTRWPDANIGCATGTASGFDVLDVDEYREGCPRVDELRQMHPGIDAILTSTPHVGTRGRGYQCFFAHVPGVRNTTDLAGMPGVDVRGDGGFVVLPPSRLDPACDHKFDTPKDRASMEALGVKPGGIYEWQIGPSSIEGGWEIFPHRFLWPEDLLRAVLVPSAARPAKPAAAPSNRLEQAREAGRDLLARIGVGSTAYGLAAVRLARTRLETATEGRRNATLNREAFGLYQLHAGEQLGAADLEQALADLAGLAERAGLDPAEVARTLESARKGQSSPRAPKEQGDKRDQKGFPPLLSPSSGGSESEGEPSWEPLHRVGAAQEPPSFPVAALPAQMARWAEAQAKSLCCPVDLPATLTMAAASACVAGRYRLKVHETWHEGLNLWVLIGLPSGERKSAAFNPALQALREWESRQRAEGGQLVAESQSKRRELEARLKRAEKEAAEGGSQLDREKAARDLARHIDYVPPRMLTEDVTSEALGSLMGLHGGRIGLFSDEGAPLKILAGRYSDGNATLELWNKAWTATPYTCDRVLRQGVHIERPTLTVMLAVQPQRIEDLADTKDFKETGTLARFLFSVPHSLVGDRDFNTAPVPGAVQAAYDASLRALIGLPEEKDEHTQAFVPLQISLSHEARQELRSFQERLEPRIRPLVGDLSSMADWVNKAPAQALRIAALIHLTETAAGGTDPRSKTVSKDAMLRALRIVEGYFLPHAMRAFDLMQTSAFHQRLRLLARWIEDLPMEERAGVTVRDAHKRLDHVQDMEADLVRSLLRELVARGYLAEAQREAATGGRPKSPRYIPNPALYAPPPVREPGQEG